MLNANKERPSTKDGSITKSDGSGWFRGKENLQRINSIASVLNSTASALSSVLMKRSLYLSGTISRSISRGQLTYKPVRVAFGLFSMYMCAIARAISAPLVSPATMNPLAGFMPSPAKCFDN